MKPRLDAVLLIALKTHWSLADIRSLPIHEFHHILERLTSAPDGD